MSIARRVSIEVRDGDDSLIIGYGGLAYYQTIEIPASEVRKLVKLIVKLVEEEAQALR